MDIELNRIMHTDLRELLRDFEAMGEVKTIHGADPHLEISALAETLALRFPGEEPALLFDKIKGYAAGFRILSGAANSFARLAHVHGLPVLRGPPYQSNRAVIDACRPWGWKDEFPRVAEANPELKEKVMKKWAHLFRAPGGRP